MTDRRRLAGWRDSRRLAGIGRTIDPMDERAARRHLLEARVARLATVTADGRPHVVPCCFTVSGAVAYWAVDGKPKSTLALRRLENLAANESASLLADHFEEDWTKLWWVRADGRGRIVDDDEERARAVASLVDKYPQYHTVPMPGPVIALEIDRWRWWAAAAS